MQEQTTEDTLNILRSPERIFIRSVSVVFVIQMEIPAD